MASEWLQALEAVLLGIWELILGIGSTNGEKFLGIAVLAGMMPLSVFTFFQIRLNKKEHQLNEFLASIGENQQASKLSKSLREEYSRRDYVIPATLATLICILGFHTLFSSYSLIVTGPGGETSKLAYNLMLSQGLPDGTVEPDRFYRLLSLRSMILGFLGAYIWSLQSIFRRLVTIDLSPAAFYSICVRMVLAAFVALIFHHFAMAVAPTTWTHPPARLMPVVAFIIGMFPERGLYYLRDWVFKLIGIRGVAKNFDLPLEMIQGINAFHRIRLGEAGIDNAQNLATGNLFDLILKTPFRPRTLIDWIAQANLYMRFPNDLLKLNKAGIRTIFDLQSARGHQQFPKLADDMGIPVAQIEIVCTAVQNDSNLAMLSDTARKVGRTVTSRA